MHATENPTNSNKRKRESNDVGQTPSKRTCVQQSTSLFRNNSFLKRVISHEEFCFQKCSEIILAQRKVCAKTVELNLSITFFCVIQTSCKKLVEILSESSTYSKGLLEECQLLVLRCVSARTFLSTFATQFKLPFFISEINSAFTSFTEECLAFVEENTQGKKEILELGEACLIYNHISFAIGCFRKASNLFKGCHDDYLKCCVEIDEIINKYEKILKDKLNKDLDPLLLQYQKEISNILKSSEGIASSDSENREATQPMIEVDKTNTDEQNLTQEHPSNESSSEESSYQESLSKDNMEEINTELQ